MSADDWIAVGVAVYAVLLLVVVPWIFKQAGKDI